MTDKEKIIAYIDKLLEKYPKNYYLLTVAEFIDSLQEEPVSEDLEKAAKRYATEGDEISGLYITDEEVDAFKVGAKWQKQQMMKDAIETTLSKGLEEDYNIKGKYKAYIIVIKED